MVISEDIFQDYLVEKGFKKDEHQLYRKIGDDIVICGIMCQSRYSTTICSFEIMVTSKGDRKFFDIIFDWDEFQSKIKAILRQYRLDKILNENK
jgi:5-keto 4-deoxyuronate isomerase